MGPAPAFTLVDNRIGYAVLQLYVDSLTPSFYSLIRDASIAVRPDARSSSVLRGFRKREAMSETKRWIMHLDMDAFYASVETHDNPSMAGRPVIVAGLSARGVVCAANYEARKRGVRSAMPTQQARVLCRKGIFLRPRMERYQEVSRRVFSIIRDYTDLVEPVSIDECFMDVTDNAIGIDSPVELGHQLKHQIRTDLRLTASLGLAPNKFIAKIASDLDKPDGYVIVEHDMVESFLADLPVECIPGIGPVTQRRLQQHGIHIIRDLRELTREQLERLFGKAGVRLYERARGIDERSVVTERSPKSLSREQTFERDTTDLEKIRSVLRSQAQSVADRLKRRGLRAGAVELKVRYEDFQSNTRSMHVDIVFDDAETIFNAAIDLMERTDTGERPVRLIGVGVSDLVEKGAIEQLDFFG